MKDIKQHVETIYCDDVRHEIGNKLSFMGVYSGELFVRKLPLILPTFCIVIKVVSFTHEKLLPITVKIIIDDEVVREETIYSDDKDETDNRELQVVNNQFDLSPAKTSSLIFKLTSFELKKECVIKVRGFIEGEDETLKGLALKVIEAP